MGLTQKSSDSIDSMANELKDNGKSLKFSDSQLVEAIIELFFKKYFKKERDHFEKLFFDRKKALLQIVKESKSPDELEDSLAELLTRKRTRKNPKRLDGTEE